MTTCCVDLKQLRNNTKNELTLTLTDQATRVAVNGKTVTWVLVTTAGATLASGSFTDSGAGGIYTGELSQANAALMTTGNKYLFKVRIVADGFEKTFEVQAIVN
jgi:hypothetical protein